MSLPRSRVLSGSTAGLKNQLRWKPSGDIWRELMRLSPFLLEVFSEIPEKPRERNRVYTVSIPLRRFSWISSFRYSSYCSS